jgi:serine/threonine protein kinase
VGEHRESWGAEPGDAVVPGWRVLQPLGGGKLTEVYLVARGEGREDRAVVKLARPGAGRGAVSSLTREVRHLAAVDDPGIPRLLHDGVRDDRPHLVVEHVAGTKLSTRVRLDGPVRSERVTELGATVAGALAAMHDADVAHLDVKPGNIVLGTSRAALVDLGISRDLAAAARLRTPVGTRRWMSPEQRDPDRFSGMGPEADVWGLGASLFLALTGRGPIDHLEIGDTKRFDVTPADVADLFLAPGMAPSWLADVVLACLTWEPDDRPTASAVRDALAREVEGAGA